jgi:hypothetical protein
VEERGKKEKKRKNTGTTSDKPNKTINIDLCFVHSKEGHEPNFSAFFQLMDESCEKSSENGEKGIKNAEKGGLDIFSHEKRSYDEKMDAYVLMRRNKADKQEGSKKTNIKEIERKADTKQEEEELRAWRRKIRIERRKGDEEWKKYRDERIELKKRWKELQKDEKNGFRWDKKRSDEEWERKKVERGN